MGALHSALPDRAENPGEVDNEQIAQLLRTTPEALAAFESAYSAFEDQAPVSENVFAVNSRQAAALAREKGARPVDVDLEHMIASIVTDLHRDPASLEAGANEDERSNDVRMDQIMALPEGLRPQLTATGTAARIGDSCGVRPRGPRRGS